MWGKACATRGLKNSPGDSEVQPGLRGTELRQEERLLSKEVGNMGTC